MAKRLGVSAMAVSRIWRAFGLRPHRVDSFKLSPDPLLNRQGPRRRGLYLNPRQGGRLLRGREVRRSGLGPHSASAADAAWTTGTADSRLSQARYDIPVRGLEIANSKVIGQIHRRHRSVEFRKFLDAIDTNVPEELDVHLSWTTPAPTSRP